MSLKRCFYIFIVFFFIFFLIFVLFINRTVNPVFFSIAEAEAVRIANKVINESINQEIDNVVYEDLVQYEINNEGYIVLMKPDIREINRFSSRIALDIQDKLEKIEYVPVSIPLLRILGLDILAGMGPKFEAKVIPIGFVHPPIVMDRFESAGINQTRHKIYLQVDLIMRLIIPFSNKNTVVNADLPVFEVTIMGQVPEFYVGIQERELSGLLRPRE